MFLFGNRRRASESLYRNLFAILAFVALVIAFITHSPVAFLAVLIFGALSRTAFRKGWKNPWFSKYVPWLYRQPLLEEEPQEDNSSKARRG